MDNDTQAKIEQFSEIMEGMDQYREALRGFVAALMSDGFDEKQARALVTRVMSTKSDDEEQK